MYKSEIMQFKRDLIISTQINVIRYLLEKEDYNFTKSHIYGDMIRKYPQYEEGKISDMVSNVLFELFDSSNIKKTINAIIEQEEEEFTINELEELEGYRY